VTAIVDVSWSADVASDVRQVVQFLFESEGMRAETTANDQAPLDHIAQHRPSLLMLDMVLPVLDGDVIATELHKLHSEGLSIIMLSADSRAAEKERCIRAVGYLHKLLISMSL
jgi:CheY-like chemotaxis protein